MRIVILKVKLLGKTIITYWGPVDDLVILPGVVFHVRNKGESIEFVLVMGVLITELFYRL